MVDPTLKITKSTLVLALLAVACTGATGVASADDASTSPARLNAQQMATLVARFASPQKVAEQPVKAPATRSERSIARGAEPARSAPPIEAADGVVVSRVALPAPSLNALVRNGERPANNALRLLLRDMVSKALQHSPEVQVANANELAAGYDIDEVKGRRWPQVRLGMDTALTRDESRSGRSRSGGTSGTLNVTTNVWDWGKNAGELRTAKAGLGSAEQTGQSEREQVAFDTSTQLINLMRYQQSMVVAEEYVQQMSRRVDMLSKITESDKGRASELVQAQAKLLSAQASRKQIENQRELARIKLHRLLGEQVPELPTQLVLIDSLVIDPESALAALDKHPMLLRLKAQAEMERGRAATLKADGLPGVNLVARKEQNGLYGANDDVDRNNDWYVGLDVQWLAFSGGSSTAAQSAASARSDAALEQYDKAYEDLRQEINRLVQSRAVAVQLAQEYQRLEVETDKVRKMFYDQWYNLGKRTLLDVLVAENDHFNSQLQAINNTYDSVIADVSILSSSALLRGYLSL
ncbi:TolC family protein [Pseudomonas sp. VB3]|uniref:TolC family protein n=1 Tax=Pseudomonas sp. VB3 TaxID=2994641 RepID=UPI0022EC3362|nr:TolC family protein [Pseudomonas sp. VB3]